VAKKGRQKKKRPGKKKGKKYGRGTVFTQKDTAPGKSHHQDSLKICKGGGLESLLQRAETEGV